MAAQVPVRLELILSYEAAFLIQIPKARSQLNKLQILSTRPIPGCSYTPLASWRLAATQCGWHVLLGTRVLEKAIVAHAGLLLLPD